MEGSSSKSHQQQQQPSSSSSLSNLLCQEDKSCLNEEEQHKFQSTHQILNSQIVPYFNDSSSSSLNSNNHQDVDDSFVQLMLHKERNYNPFNSSSISSSNFPSWLKTSRILAINWILNTQTSFGFSNHTAYLSVLYLDHFLSRKYIYEDQSWGVILLSVACLSIAVKMEESKVPALSEYQVENFEFGANVVQNMELIVLTTLEWKMSLVTPFVYINYFIKQFGGDHQGSSSNQDGVISRVSELVMGLIKESSSMEEFRPFVVAAAAVVAASDWQLTQEALRVKLSTVSLWEISDNEQKKQQQEEQLFACYSIMQRLCAKENPNTPNVTEVEQSAAEQSGAATPRLAGTKRRLTFRDSDQNPDLPDDKHRG